MLISTKTSTTDIEQEVDRYPLTIPLLGNLIPSVAEAPRVIVNCFSSTDSHAFFAGALTVKFCDFSHDLLALRRDLDGLDS